MTAGVFLIQEDGGLVEMSETPYASEAILQELIARYPNLLVGDQIDTATPRRWLLVSREMGLASEEDGGGRWALDHLFLDQDAVPTLVEVKRSSDTRIRREVIGQMLDYAANAVVYLPVEQIKGRFEDGCRARKQDPDGILSEFLGPEVDAGEFWQRVKTNLQAGKVRLLFVADVIPPELRRIVEFLNEQMDPAEVLAIEIRHFASGGMKTLVPRVIGQTAEAERKKVDGRRDRREWAEESFFADLEKRTSPDAVAAARRILDWGRKHAYRIAWGNGKRDGSFIPVLEGPDGTPHYPIAIYSYGRVEIQFQYLKYKTPFDDAATRREFLDLLNRIPGVQLPADSIDRRPSIALVDLKPEAAWTGLEAALSWCVKKVEAA